MSSAIYAVRRLSRFLWDGLDPRIVRFFRITFVLVACHAVHAILVPLRYLHTLLIEGAKSYKVDPAYIAWLEQHPHLGRDPKRVRLALLC